MFISTVGGAVLADGWLTDWLTLESVATCGLLGSPCGSFNAWKCLFVMQLQYQCTVLYQRTYQTWNSVWPFVDAPKAQRCWSCSRRSSIGCSFSSWHIWGSLYFSEWSFQIDWNNMIYGENNDMLFEEWFNMPWIYSIYSICIYSRCYFWERSLVRHWLTVLPKIA